jgi:hypothetical protein
MAVQNSRSTVGLLSRMLDNMVDRSPSVSGLAWRVIGSSRPCEASIRSLKARSKLSRLETIGFGFQSAWPCIAVNTGKPSSAVSMNIGSPNVSSCRMTSHVGFQSPTSSPVTDSPSALRPGSDSQRSPAALLLGGAVSRERRSTVIQSAEPATGHPAPRCRLQTPILWPNLYRSEYVHLLRCKRVRNILALTIGC